MVTKMRILIGYDGSDCSDIAISDLAKAGLPPEVEAVVLSVTDAWPSVPVSPARPLDEAELAKLPRAAALAHHLAAQALAEARSRAAEGAARVRERFPKWHVTAEACGDSPYRGLVVKADKWRPDLLVVGSNGRSAVGRMVLGSVSQNVLSHAICSVRVARRRDDTGRLADEPSRIIVGIDGSPDSAAAVAAVADRAWPKGTEVRVISAIDPRASLALLAYGPPTAAWAAAAGAPDGRTWAKSAVENSAEELRRAGLDAVGLALDGDPKRVLVDEAEQWKADCIFVGAKGHSRMERFLLGSVSASVAARADCTVEVVRTY
jgi:nucleotide-binding universal stress UspA family protein